MHAFTDNCGRTWEIVINVAVLRRIKGLCKLDLLDAEGRSFERLADDPILLCDVLYAICKPQATEKGVSDEQFGEGLAGDAIDDATEALLAEIVDFFPQRRRALMRKARDKMFDLEKKQVQYVDKFLDGPELDETMGKMLAGMKEDIDRRLKIFGPSSMNSPESSE